eukprot:1880901-Rhodomonas_salina.1
MRSRPLGQAGLVSSGTSQGLHAAPSTRLARACAPSPRLARSRDPLALLLNALLLLLSLIHI